MMSRKPFYLVVLTLFFVAAAGMIYHTSTLSSENEDLATENVKIVKDNDDIWRVRDTKNNSNRGVMRVRSADRIFWQPQGSRVQFQFHKNATDYFEYDEGLFEDGRTQIVDNNDMLRVAIKESAPRDSLVYDVYVYADDAYVVGSSPPVMIVY